MARRRNNDGSGWLWAFGAAAGLGVLWLSTRPAGAAEPARAPRPAAVPPPRPVQPAVSSPLVVDADGWLVGDGVKRVPSHANNKLEVPVPLGLIWHTTDTPPGRTAQSLAEGIRTAAGLKSWNVLIAQDGGLWQSVPFTLASWHVGNAGTIEGRHFNNVNKGTIGVELQNAGRLKKIDGKFYMWPYFRTKLVDGKAKADPKLGVDPKLVIDADRAGADDKGVWWELFTAPQIAAAERLVRALAAWRPTELGRASAFQYGHVNFPGTTGKEDPGRTFPAIRDAMLARVFGPLTAE
jgi:N-acetyl-anhydromuramyl-L-alanine amidase AmpD